MVAKDITYLHNIRCFAVVTNEDSKLFGQPCGKLLMTRNDFGEAAGRVQCPRCGTLYEIGKNKMIIIRGGKK